MQTSRLPAALLLGGGLLLHLPGHAADAAAHLGQSLPCEDVVPLLCAEFEDRLEARAPIGDPERANLAGELCAPDGDPECTELFHYYCPASCYLEVDSDAFPDSVPVVCSNEGAGGDDDDDDDEDFAHPVHHGQ